MAYAYNVKVVVSGKHVEVFTYKKSIWRETTSQTTKKPKKLLPKNVPTEEQIEAKKQKALFSLNRTKTQIRRLIDANPQLQKFLTLTFAENITDLKQANYVFNQFIKRLSYRYPHFEYLAVPEFQKRGAVHYHLLCNLPFIEIGELQAIWQQGFIKLNKITNQNHLSAYVSKYLSKDAFDERTFGKKKFFRSQSLAPSIEVLGFWAKRFIDFFLKTLLPQQEKIFSSEWTGEVHYRLYTLPKPPLFKKFFTPSVPYSPL